MKILFLILIVSLISCSDPTSPTIFRSSEIKATWLGPYYPYSDPSVNIATRKTIFDGRYHQSIPRFIQVSELTSAEKISNLRFRAIGSNICDRFDTTKYFYAAHTIDWGYSSWQDLCLPRQLDTVVNLIRSDSFVLAAKYYWPFMAENRFNLKTFKVIAEWEEK